MPQQIKINETHLIALKKDEHGSGVSITYLPLANPLRGLLDDAYNKCEDDLCYKEYANEILGSDERLRKVILSKRDFCLNLRGTYQGLSNQYIKFNPFFTYRENFTDQELRDDVLKDKEFLKKSLETYGLAYAIETTRKSAENDRNIIAISHRSHGWSYPSFSLTRNLDVQFLTNFGFGRTSYFYTKLRYKNIDIVPFSEWIRYEDSRYDEILSYSQDYFLSNHSWQSAMEYVRDAINLCVENEAGFVEKYITSECEWLVNGLKDIVAERKDVNDFDEKIDRMDYKGIKISGALNFIKSIKEYESVISVKKFIDDIEQLNNEILPALFQELGQINYDLHLAEINLTELAPKYNKMKEKFLPLERLYNRISKFKDKNPDASKDLQRLFKIKYHDFDEIQREHTTLRKKNNEIESLIRNLNSFDRKFKGYIKKITNYFDY
jgi:hypothetical protein